MLENAVLWEPGTVSRRDLFYGPGGREMQPDISKVTFIKEEKQGHNKKYRIRDANVGGEPPEDAPEQIDVVQILVKHDGVKGAVAEGVTRSREDACLRATEARAVLLSQSDWDAAYKEYSDDQGPSKGVIQGLKRGDYGKAFSAAAFSARVNDVTQVVETKRGFHVILRTQ